MIIHCGRLYRLISASLLILALVLLSGHSVCFADDLTVTFNDSGNDYINIKSARDMELSSFKVNNPYRLVVDLKNISVSPQAFQNRHKQIKNVLVNQTGNSARIAIEPIAGIQLFIRQNSQSDITIFGTQVVPEGMAPQPSSPAKSPDARPAGTEDQSKALSAASTGQIMANSLVIKDGMLNIGTNGFIENITTLSIPESNRFVFVLADTTLSFKQGRYKLDFHNLTGMDAEQQGNNARLTFHVKPNTTVPNYFSNKDANSLQIRFFVTDPVKEPAQKTSGKKQGSEQEIHPATKYKGPRISLDFDNADLRHIFRMLAEISKINFVLNDEIKGTMSLKLMNVPWEQALEIVVKNNNLAVEHVGNVIEILPKQIKIERNKAENDVRLQEMRQKLEEQMAKETVEGMATKTIQLKHVSAVKMSESLKIMLSQGSADVSTEQGQQQGQELTQGQASASTKSDVKRSFTAAISPEPNTNKIIVRDYISKIDKIEKLVIELDVPERQVMIEARIVVATSDFTRDFGVQWGVHYRDGSASFLGINSVDTGFGGVASAPPTSGQFSGSSGVNTGISFGTLASNIQLDMRLSAATAANMVKVIATPKIVTLNNEPAKIEQGQSTFVQTIDKLGIPSMTSVTATLKLDVTPSIKSNDNITLKIDASDDSFGLPPPGAASVAINKRTATSKILLKDGETAVIGGIFREQNTDANSGVPYLKDIPLLGHLFKSSSTINKREELLIFITPRVINNI